MLLCLPCLHCFALLCYEDPPTLGELEAALSQEGRWPVRYCARVFFVWRFCSAGQVTCIIALKKRVWDEGRVVDAWRDALIVPVPKKGNLESCDNCRGISLLNVLGKIFGN